MNKLEANALVELAIQKAEFHGGGFVLHKITGPFKGRASGWFNKSGKLIDAEHIVRSGTSRSIKANGPIWRHIASHGVLGKRVDLLATIHPRLVELARKIEFGDPRPRNSMGEYTSDPGDGVDPNQMAAAYGPPEVSQSHLERVKNFFLKRRQAQAAE